MTLFPWKLEGARQQADPGLQPAVAIPRLQVVTAATVDPVTVDELKALLKIEGGDENAVLTMYLKAAVKLAEIHTGRAFCTRTLKLWLDHFPAGKVLQIPVAPVSAVESLEYYADGEATPTTFASSNYITDLISSPARLVLENGSTWPTDLRSANAVVVSLTAGYGAAAAVPEGIKQGILAIAAEGYHAQGAQVEAAELKRKMKIPADAFLYLEPYRIFR